MEELDCMKQIANSTDSYNVGMNAIRGIVCSVGVVGNLVVIFVIVVLKEYQQAVTHWYVLQLAIADVFFLLTLPFAILEASQQVWTLSQGICKMKEAILFINYYSSVLFLIVMSIDRYIAVCCPFSTQLQRLRKKKAAYIITIAIWLISLGSSIPIMVFTKKTLCSCGQDFPSDNREAMCEAEGLAPGKECDEFYEEYSKEYDYTTGSFETSDFWTNNVTEYFDGDEYSGIDDDNDEESFHLGCSYGILPDGFKAYIYFNFIAMFVIPSLCMIICYTLIAMRLKKTRMQSAHNKRKDRNRVRVTILCLLLVALFIICWLPYHAQHLAKMNGISGTSERCNKIATVTTLMIFLNSALNPYVYNFIGRRFSVRLRRAAGSVKTTIRRSTHSFSADKTIVKYNARKGQSLGDSDNLNSTTGTKLSSKRSSETTEIRMSTKLQVEMTNLVVHEDPDKKVEE